MKTAVAAVMRPIAVTPSTPNAHHAIRTDRRSGCATYGSALNPAALILQHPRAWYCEIDARRYRPNDFAIITFITSLVPA